MKERGAPFHLFSLGYCHQRNPASSCPASACAVCCLNAVAYGPTATEPGKLLHATWSSRAIATTTNSIADLAQRSPWLRVEPRRTSSDPLSGSRPSIMTDSSNPDLLSAPVSPMDTRLPGRLTAQSSSAEANERSPLLQRSRSRVRISTTQDASKSQGSLIKSHSYTGRHISERPVRVRDRD